MNPRPVLLIVALTLSVFSVAAVEFPALTVVPEPESAQVQILNHGVRYEPGVWLHPGEYRIQVSHPEYESVIRRVRLTDADRVVRIALPAKGTLPAPALAGSPQSDLALPGTPRATPARLRSTPPRVGRYSIVAPVTTGAQRALLDVTREIDHFPPHVTTVGAAIEVLLGGSGYALEAGGAADPRLPTLLALPLPAVHRSLGIVRLRDALEALAGPGWQLVVDPVHRRVSYQVADPYALDAPAAWR